MTKTNKNWYAIKVLREEQAIWHENMETYNQLQSAIELLKKEEK
jgi:hypothetical protein